MQWTTKYGEDGKPRKVPYSASGGEAKVNDPTTWAPLADVERMRERSARRGIRRAPDGSVPPGGVGIVFMSIGLGRHLGGVDLDSCILDDGALAPWAREIVESLNSLRRGQPVRPRGQGLFTYDPRLPDHHWRHEAKRPAVDGGKDPGIEFYLEKRYFAVTGKQFEGFDTVRFVPVGTLLTIQRLMGTFAPDTSASPKRNGSSGRARRRPSGPQSSVGGLGGYPERRGVHRSQCVALDRHGHAPPVCD